VLCLDTFVSFHSQLKT